MASGAASVPRGLLVLWRVAAVVLLVGGWHALEAYARLDPFLTQSWRGLVRYELGDYGGAARAYRAALAEQADTAGLPADDPELVYLQGDATRAMAVAAAHHAIKNPPTKQTTAIRSLHAPRRLALTGTPVENRLSELWSIMDFCNPGYLCPAGEFRRRYSMAIERRRDQLQAENLRRLVRPFILRRVKTDPTVINDLPPCVETKEYATLTAEQATMYQRVVNGMLGEIDRAEGIQRRGLVLAALVRLKQICNHPAQVNGEIDESGVHRTADSKKISAATTFDVLTAASSRSGKTQRLLSMLEEVAASDGKALIFTQFRQMGHLLTAMIQNELDCEVLFLHGGTPAAKRQHLIDRFQAADGGVPFFVLSLKAGGLGLNLTAANHVFHFDRWWNPAVENQATDRAFRIGQTRKVHVHKFVCVGTLEERIDQMIEQKTELATNIIGSGEQWLTEFSTGQLRDMLMLRQDAVEGES
jgi:SNF2 family DNA or RNA helicase